MILVVAIQLAVQLKTSSRYKKCQTHDKMTVHRTRIKYNFEKSNLV